MIRIVVATTILAFCVSVVSAQQADVASARQTAEEAGSGIGVTPARSSFSLLDGSRITWSHSYSVSFFSGGNVSGSVGFLSSTMHYEISTRLSLAVNLGVVHNTSALWGSGQHNATLLPGFRLDYRPADNIFMSVSYQQYPGGYVPSYWSRGSRLLWPYFGDGLD